MIAQLDKPQDYYQQRRLFPSERVARDPDAVDRVDRVDRLNAKELKHGPSCQLLHLPCGATIGSFANR